MNTNFSVPTEIVTGLGSLERLTEIRERLGAENIGVVVDDGLRGNGVMDLVLDNMPEFVPTCVSGFSQNPSVSSV